MGVRFGFPRVTPCQEFVYNAISKLQEEVTTT